jgi:hypothetical protein
MRPMRNPRRLGAAIITLALALALGAGAATPAAADRGETTQEPIRFALADDEHGLMVFVNVTRESLCTDERLAYEDELLAWFDSDMTSAPPEEPASSPDGIVLLELSESDGPGGFAARLRGEAPVELWTWADEPAPGFECRTTEGAGASLFATGLLSVDQRFRGNAAGGIFHLDLKGGVTTPEGQDYRYRLSFGSAGAQSSLVRLG